MKEFVGKVSVVTGATSGIGAATAKKFAELGADVALVGRNYERGSALEEELKPFGVRVKFFKCDVSDVQQAEETADAIAEKLSVLI